MLINKVFLTYHYNYFKGFRDSESYSLQIENQDSDPNQNSLDPSSNAELRIQSDPEARNVENNKKL